MLASQKMVDGEVAGENVDFFVCHRSDDRNGLINTISYLSGPTTDMRIMPSMETLITEALHRRMASRIICISFAMARMPTGEEKLTMCVLTEIEFSGFEVDFDKWIVPASAQPHHDTTGDHADVLDIIEGEQKSAKSKTFMKVRGIMDEDQILRHREDDEEDDENGKSRNLLAERAARLAKTQKEVDAGWIRSRPARSLWDGFNESRLEEVEENRMRAAKKTEEAIVDSAEEANTQGGVACMGFRTKAVSSTASAVLLKPDQVRNKVETERRKNILECILKEPIVQLERIEFDGGDLPRLKLVFKGKKKDSPKLDVDLLFLDDAARESWRRGLALTLHRGSADEQWQREWDTPAAGPAF